MIVDIIKLQEMLRTQDGLNRLINADWKTAKNPWTRAIWIEAAELLEHVGWKWWKQQTPNYTQAEIELVDIWHFILSLYVENVNEASLGELASAMAYHMNDRGRRITVYQERVVCADDLQLRERIELLAAAAAAGSDTLPYFAAICELAGLTFERLYQLYICKNVLNTFRQHHGYKEGTYIKTWHGAEDNVVLERLMADHPEANGDQLYALLASAYEQVKKEAA